MLCATLLSFLFVVIKFKSYGTRRFFECLLGLECANALASTKENGAGHLGFTLIQPPRLVNFESIFINHTLIGFLNFKPSVAGRLVVTIFFHIFGWIIL